MHRSDGEEARGVDQWPASESENGPLLCCSRVDSTSYHPQAQDECDQLYTPHDAFYEECDKLGFAFRKP